MFRVFGIWHICEGILDECDVDSIYRFAGVCRYLCAIVKEQYIRRVYRPHWVSGLRWDEIKRWVLEVMVGKRYGMVGGDEGQGFGMIQYCRVGNGEFLMGNVKRKGEGEQSFPIRVWGEEVCDGQNWLRRGYIDVDD